MINSRNFNILTLSIIVLFAIIPLFVSFPYRVNIFLSWEGAYRMYLGQMPFRDFKLPMGYGYWIIPYIFFGFFGPFLSSLIKAQVFINILSGLAFWYMLRAFKIKESIIFLSVLVYCISYSFFNFWPWYNHSVIVYQFIALSFLLNAINGSKQRTTIKLVLSAFFLFLSFFTKQDGGALGILIALSLLIVDFIYTRKVKHILIFSLALIISASLFIVPLLEHDFTYWFNLGQEPHNSRLSLKDFVDVIFGESIWIKFYLFIIVFSLLGKLKVWKAFLLNKQQVLFYLFVLAIFVEALLFQVTSYTPPNNNIFFHSFGFVFLLVEIFPTLQLNKLKILLPGLAAIFIWWSGTYWKYIDRILTRAIPSYGQVDDDKISIKTFMKTGNENNIGMDKWEFSGLRAFENVYMPGPTVEGIKRLKESSVVKDNKKLKVLNMTELTPLAHELPFELEKNLPLWYHEGVGMFSEQTDLFVDRIEKGYYDVILFETIPYLNNFFPERVRKSAKENYEQVDRFLAPRRPTDSHIEVYFKKTTNEGI